MPASGRLVLNRAPDERSCSRCFPVNCPFVLTDALLIAHRQTSRAGRELALRWKLGSQGADGQVSILAEEE